MRCVAAPALARSASLAAQSPAVTKLHIRAHKVCRICGNKDPTLAAGRRVELCRRSSNRAQVLEVQWTDGVNARFGAELLRVSSPSAENAASGGPRVRAGRCRRACPHMLNVCSCLQHTCRPAAAHACTIHPNPAAARRSTPRWYSTPGACWQLRRAVSRQHRQHRQHGHHTLHCLLGSSCCPACCSSPSYSSCKRHAAVTTVSLPVYL